MGRVMTRKRKLPAHRPTWSGSEDDECDVSPSRSRPSPFSSDASAISDSDRHSKKRRRTVPRKADQARSRKPWGDILHSTSTVPVPVAMPLSRSHTVAYHRPLLLDAADARNALLQWFDAVSSVRQMPWRKPWIDPTAVDHRDAAALRDALERRAYEVWISEVMLQQTRVAVVIDYWTRWMATWPTIHHLAKAAPEDVLSAWRGLGYYSRATRLHQAAQLVVHDPCFKGLLPAEPHVLRAKIPGIGPYTAGAISAIVFGHPVAMVDGNVIRVLSRQMGVYADLKASKTVTDLIWDAADALVKAVFPHPPADGSDAPDHHETSDRPGRWGQALMELGSTVCTPKPGCSKCPVTSTCRAFAEGGLMANAPKARQVVTEPTRTLDIEELCVICQPMEETAVIRDAMVAKSLKKTRPRAGRMDSGLSGSPVSVPGVSEGIDPFTLGVIVDYATRFPAKGVKKAVRVEESLVCAIRLGDSYLIRKRPSKGLLASLWELPSSTVPSGNKSTARTRKRLSWSFVSNMLKQSSPCGTSEGLQLRHVGELGSVPWLFSHIRMTMYVHVFEVQYRHDWPLLPDTESRWASDDEIDKETMGTGMQKCWNMVKVSDA